MAENGILAPFDSKIQEWEEYCNIEHFFIANYIEDVISQKKSILSIQKKSILLSIVGAATYSLKRNLPSPTNPRDLRTVGSFVKP